MGKNYEFDVFLAHHSGDKAFVRGICTRLKQYGLKPWIDEEQIPPGRSFQQGIQQAIPKVKTAAIILGPSGVGRWQDWEIQAFFALCVNKGTIVIPVLLPGVGEVPESLSFLQQLRWINFTNERDLNALKLLVWGITGKQPKEGPINAFPALDRTRNVRANFFDADTCFNQAKAQYALQNYQAAIEGFSVAIHYKPNFAEAYFSRGNALRAIGDDSGAEQDYLRAKEIGTNATHTHCTSKAETVFQLQHARNSLTPFLSKTWILQAAVLVIWLITAFFLNETAPRNLLYILIISGSVAGIATGLLEGIALKLLNSSIKVEDFLLKYPLLGLCVGTMGWSTVGMTLGTKYMSHGDQYWVGLLSGIVAINISFLEFLRQQGTSN